MRPTNRQLDATRTAATAQAPRVRIAFITTIADTQWHFLRGQNRYLAARGFEIHAIAAPGPMLARLARRDGVHVHPVPMTRSIHPLHDLIALWRLWRVLRQVQPHLVHVSTPKAALIGSIAAALARTPARILLLRGLPFEGATGIRRLLLRSADRIAARLCHRTLCVSSSLREVACRERIISDQKSAVPGSGMSNGVDTVRLDPHVIRAADLGFDPQNTARFRAPVIGFVGRLARDKGLDVLVAAFDLVRAQYSDAKLLLVGGWDESDPPPAELRARLQRDPSVRLTGEVDDPAPWLKAMTVFVFPSRREGFPNAPMEAAAMALPVVAAGVTGVRNAVVSGVTGQLVPPDDPTAMAAAVCDYLRNPDLRRRHGHAARERVVREFQPQRVWLAMLEEYTTLLRQRGGPLPHASPADRWRAA